MSEENYQFRKPTTEELKKEKGLISAEGEYTFAPLPRVGPQVGYDVYLPESQKANLTPFEKTFLSPDQILVERAKNQPWYEQVGKATLNIGPNILFGLVEMAGLVGELGYYGFNELTGKEYKADFSNALTETMISWKDPFGKVYREDPNDVFDWSDTAWWINNTSSLIQSIVEFGITGFGVGSAVKAGIGAGVKALQAGVKSAALARGIAKGGDLAATAITSASLGYLEGGKTGAPVYNEVFNQKYAETGDYDLAVKEASEAAATTVKTNTALIGALSTTAVLPYMLRKGAVNQAKRFDIGIKPGEKAADYAKRMSSFQGSAPEESLFMKSRLAFEAAQESAEELGNVYAEEVGYQKAGMSEYDKTGLELFFELAKTDEGRLSMMLGALGGVGQTMVMDYMPWYKRKDKDGNMKRMSAKKLRDLEMADTGVQYAEQIAKDLQAVIEAQEELQNAIAVNDDAGIEVAKNKLFDVYSKKSIFFDEGDSAKAFLTELSSIDNTRDLSELYAEQIAQLEEAKAEATPEQIAEIDTQIKKLEEQAAQDVGKTQAMKMGLADSKEDNEYKQKAKDKINEIDELVKEYKEIKSTYNFGDEVTAGLADYIFELGMSERRLNDNISINQRAYDKYQEKIRNANKLTDPEEFEISSSLIKSTHDLEAVRQEIKDKKKELANIKENREVLKDKYQVQTEKELQETIRGFLSELKEKESSLQKEVTEKDKELIEYYEEKAKEEGEKLTQEKVNERVKLAEKDYYQDVTTKEELVRIKKAINKDTDFRDFLVGLRDKVTSFKGRSDFVKKAQESHEEKAKKFREILSEESANVQKENIRINIKENVSRKSRTDPKNNVTESEFQSSEESGVLDIGPKEKIAKKLYFKLPLTEQEQKLYDDYKEDVDTHVALTVTPEMEQEKAERKEYSDAIVEDLKTRSSRFVGIDAEGNQVSDEDFKTGKFEKYALLDATGEVEAEYEKESNIVSEAETQANINNFIKEYIRLGGMPYSQFDNYTFASNKALEELAKKLDDFTNNLKRNSETIVEGDIILLSEAGFASRPDLITTDDAGNFRIYSFEDISGYGKEIKPITKDGKTGEAVSLYDFKGTYDAENDVYIEDASQESLREKNQNKLSLYNIALDNSYGITAVEGFVVPIDTEYNEVGLLEKAEIKEAIPVDFVSFVDKYNLQNQALPFNLDDLKERFFSEDVTVTSSSEHANLSETEEYDKKAVSSFKIQYGSVRAFERVGDTRETVSNVRKEISIFESGLTDFEGMDLVLIPHVSFNGDWIDADGNVVKKTYSELLKEGTDNVPIQVVDRKTEQVIGYLPNVHWITRTVNGNYFNMATGTAENPIDVEQEAKNLSELRKRVVEEYNKEDGETLSISISSISRGTLIRNYETEDGTKEGRVVLVDGRPKFEYKKASELLPEEGLTFGIVNNGNIQIGIDKRGNKELAKENDRVVESKYKNGSFVVNIDGDYIPLKISTISERVQNTIFEGVIAKLTNNKEIIEAIDDVDPMIGFENKNGIFNFLNRFVYTQQFDHKALKAFPRRVFINSSKKGFFYIGRNNEVLTNNIKLIGKESNGITYLDVNTNQDKFKDMLSYLNIGIDLKKGLNSKELYEEIVISEGKVSTVKEKTYNEFVKESIETYINGTNFVEYKEGKETKRKYIYREQPAVYFEEVVSKEKREAITKKEEEQKPTSDLAALEEDEIKLDDVPDLWGDLDSKFDPLEDPDDDYDDWFGFPRLKEDVPLTEQQLKLLEGSSIGDFTFQQQREVTMSIIYAIKEYIDKKEEKGIVPNYDFAFRAAKKSMENGVKFLLSKGMNESAAILQQATELYWKDFSTLSETYLKSIGYSRGYDNLVESEGSNYEKRKFDSSFDINQKETANSKVKMKLSFIPRYNIKFNEDNEVESTTVFRNFIGLPSFIPLKDIWNNLLDHLVDVKSDIESMKIALKKSKDPTLNYVYKLIKDDKDFENNFFVAFNMQRVKMTIAFVKRTEDGIRAYQGQSDYNDEVSSIINTFSENMMTESPFVYQNEEGNYVINREKVKQYKEEYIKKYSGKYFTGTESFKILSEFLSNLGINLSPNDVNVYLDPKSVLRQELRHQISVENKNTFVNQVFDILLDDSTVMPTGEDVEVQDDLYSLRSPILNSGMRSDFREIARAIIRRDGSRYSGSHSNVNKDIIYPWQKPNYLYDTILKLRDNDYQKTLEKGILTSASKLKDKNIELFYVDGLKNTDSIFGKEMHRLSEIDLHLINMIYFFGRAAQTNGKEGMFTFPKSDKTVVPVLNVPINTYTYRNKDKKEGEMSLENLPAPAINDLLDYAIAEYERVINSQDYRKQGLINKEDPYYEGSKYFFMFPFLNYQYIQGYVDQGVITEKEFNILYPSENTMSADKASVEPILKKLINNYFVQTVNDTYSVLDSFGLLGRKVEETYGETGEEKKITTIRDIFIGNGYLSNPDLSTKQSPEENILNAVLNFVINNAVVEAENMILFGKDPAHYWKKSVEETLKVYEKRAAKDTAPRSPGNIKTGNKRIRRLVSNDIEKAITAEGLPDPYYKDIIDIGDGAQFATVRFFIDTQEELGKIKPEEAEALRKKIKPGKYYEFTDAEVKKYFSPIKDVYTGEEYDAELRTMRPIYVKNATFALLPQLLRQPDGSMADMDKVRVMMEDKNNNIDLLPMNSASKVGSSKVLNIFDKQGKVRTDITQEEIINSVQFFDKNYYGLQQEESPKTSENVNVVTQLDTLLFSGIRNVKGFDYAGKKYDGRTLEKHKDTILRELYRQQKDAIYSEFGIEVVDGVPIITDFSKLKDVLINAADKNNWSKKDVDALRLSEDKQSFVIPQELTPKFQTVQNLLFSNLSSIAKIKLKGKAFAQAPSLLVNSEMQFSEVQETEPAPEPTPEPVEERSIEDQVAELFEFNPELANAVYEAAGIPKVRLYRVYNPSAKGTVIEGQEKYTGQWFTTDLDYALSYIEKNKKVIKGQNVVDNKYDYSDLKVDVVELNPSEAKKYLLPQETILKEKLDVEPDNFIIPSSVARKTTINIGKEIGVSNKVIKSFLPFEKDRFKKNIPLPTTSKFENLLQLEQQALQLYSQYLDTIFPNSKVKDIVYHVGYNIIEKFIKRDNGIYFTDNIKYAENLIVEKIKSDASYSGVTMTTEEAKQELKRYSVVLNSKNIKEIPIVNSEIVKKLNKGNFDTIKGIEDKSKNVESYVVFEPEQIHILGNAEDIKEFKDFAGITEDIPVTKGKVIHTPTGRKGITSGEIDADTVTVTFDNGDVEVITKSELTLDTATEEVVKKEGESFFEMQKRVSQNLNIKKRIELAEKNNIVQGNEYSFSEIKKIFNNEKLFSNDIYNQLEKVLNSNLTFKFGSLNIGKKTINAQFDSNNNSITIDTLVLQAPNLETSDFKRILLHEIIHAAAFINLSENVKLTNTQKTALNNLNNVIKELKKDKDFFGQYGLKNANELLAELANDNFVTKLKDKKFDNNLNFFEKIISEIVKLLGLDTTAYDIVKEAFDNLVSEYQPSVKKLSVKINKERWTKDSPKENPDTAYVFTENINSIGETRTGGGTAVIRNNPNAIGIVTKKYYVYREQRNTEESQKIKDEYQGSGQWYNQNFEDTDTDFELFKQVNEEQFAKIDAYSSVIFPDGFANSLAKIPTRFAEWLQGELLNRYGLVTELNESKTGLISKEVVENEEGLSAFPSPPKPEPTIEDTPTVRIRAKLMPRYMPENKVSGMVHTKSYDPAKGLQYLRKENGEVKAAQVMVPWNFRDSKGELLNIDSFLDDDGSIDFNKLPKEVLEFVSSRIPNQAHSSTLPLEIVGFIPSSMGKTIIVPDGITLQMGSDFDIDKLYTYLPNYYYDYAENSIKLLSIESDLTDSDSLYEEIFGKIGRQSVYKGVKETIEEYNESKDIDKDIAKFLYKNLHKLLDSKQLFILTEIVKDFEINDSFVSLGALKKLPSRNSFNLRDKTGNELSWMYSMLPSSILRQMYFNIHKSVMTHPEVFDKIVDPLENNDIETEKELIGKKSGRISTTPRSPLSYLVKTKSVADKWAGATLVGVSAIGLTTNSVLEDKNINLVETTKHGEVPYSIPVEINGKIVDLDSLSGEGTSTYNGQVRTKQDNLKAFVTTAVDNANVNQAGFVNFNPYTAGVGIIMAMLQSDNNVALSMDYILRFLSQDVINKYIREISKLSGSTNSDFVKNQHNTAILNVQEELFIEYLQNTSGYDPEMDIYNNEAITNLREEALLMPIPNKDVLLKMINSSEDTSISKKQYYSHQLAMLYHFDKLKMISEELIPVRKGILNPFVDQLPTDIYAVMEMSENYDKVKAGSTMLSNLHTLIGEKNDKTGVITPNTRAAYVAEAIINPIYSIINSVFPVFGNMLNNVEGYYDQNINMDSSGNISANTKRKLWNGVVSYMWQHFEEFGLGDINERRQYLFYELPYKLSKLKNTPWGKQNIFLQKLDVVLSENVKQPSFINYQALRAKDISDQDITAAVVSLLKSNDPVQRELIQDLYEYAMISGATFDPKRFMHALPSAWFESEFTGIFDKIKELSSNVVDFENIVLQITRNRPDLLSSFSNFVKKKKKLRIKEEGGRMVGLILPKAQSRSAIGSLLKNGSYVKQFKLRDEQGNELILEKIADHNYGGEEYAVVARLGYGGVPEYYPGKSMPLSFFNENVSAKTKIPSVEKVQNPTTKEPSYTPEQQGENLINDYLSPSLTATDAIQQSLDKIKDNDYYSDVASIMKKALSRMDLSIIKSNSIPSIAGYKSKKLFLNPKQIGEEGTTHSQFQKILLHEYGHAITNELIARYKNPKLRSSLTKDQISLIKSLENVYEAVVKKLTEGNETEFKKFQKKMERVLGKDSGETLSLSVAELNWYYIRNFEEFAASVWTEDFQEVLNEIPYDSKRTFKDRVLDLINKIIRSLSKAFNIEVKDNMALKEALSIVIDLTADIPAEIANEIDAEKGESNIIDYSDDGTPIFRDLEAGLDDMLSDMDGYPTKGEPESFSAFASISNPALSGALFQTESVIKDIKSSIAGTKGMKERKRLQNLLSFYEQKLNQLTSVKTPQELLSFAESQLEYARSIMEKRSSTDKEYLLAISIIDSWDFERTRDFLPKGMNVESNPWYKSLSIAGTKRDRLEGEIINKLRAIIARSINEKFELPKKLTAEDIAVMKDLKNYYTALDASVSGVPILQYLNRILRDKQNRANSELTKVTDDIEAKIRELGFSKGDFDFMFQFDNEGKATGRIVHEYTAEYDQKMSDIYASFYERLELARGMSEENSRQAVREAVRDFHKARKDINEIIDLRKIIDPTKIDKYQKYLENEYGVEKAKEIIEVAKRKYAEYELEREMFIDNMRQEVASVPIELIYDSIKGESLKEYFDRKLDVWEKENSPIVALDKDDLNAMYEEMEFQQSEKPSDDSPSKQKITNKGDRYLLFVPRKKVNGVETNYYSTAYDNLTENQIAWLEYFSSFIMEMKKNFPVSVQNSMPDNFYPTILKDTASEMLKNQFGRFVDQEITKRLTKGTVSFGDIQEKRTKSEERRLRRSNKLGNTRNLIKYVDTENKVNPDDISKNVELVMKRFAEMAIFYKHKNDIEAEALLINRIIQGSDEVDLEGNLIPRSKSLMNIKKQAEHMIKSGVYDQKADESSPSKFVVMDGFNIINNNKKRRRLKEIQKEYAELERQLLEEEIEYEEYQQDVEALEIEYNMIGGKPLVMSRVLQSFLELNQLKHMGWNIRAGFANMGFGMLSVFTWSAGNPEFTTQNVITALGIMMRSGTKRKDLKVANVIKKMNVLFEVRDVTFGRGNSRLETDVSKLKFISKNISAFEIQRKTEYFVQGLSMLSQMINTQVEVTRKDTGEVETIPLFYALNENGDWNTEIYEEQEDWDYIEGDKMSSFRNKVIKTNYYMHGNYDPDNLPMFKRSVYMRALFQFRSWIPYGFAQRFIGDYYDPDLGRNFKGRYRTYSDIGVAKSLKGMMSILFSNRDKANEKLKGENIEDIDIANLRMNLRELQILAGLIFFGFLIKSAMPDDDEDEEFVRGTMQILVNQLYRIEQDIYFYVSLNTLEDILRNPVPVFKLYIDYINALSASIEYLSDPSGYEKDSPLKKFAKANPGSNQVVNIMYSATNSYRDK